MQDVRQIVQNERDFFNTGATRSVKYRIDALKALRKSIESNVDYAAAALKSDLNKHPYETFMCETSIVLNEIDYHIGHLRGWARRKPVKPSVFQFPGLGFAYPEPLGVVLIIAPWNYPVQLCLMPLVGAISAGNCAVVKPSELAPESSAAIKKIISEAFPSDYVTVVEGGLEESDALLHEKFDHIFFTGGERVGKIVMNRASDNLTPVTLELGGKSPVVVDETADVKLAARRIAFGKTLNAGQTCVAPDYLLIHESKKEAFVAEWRKVIDEFFPDGDKSEMVTILNERHFDRLLDVLSCGTPVAGGSYDRKRLFIEPTLLDDAPLDSVAMKEEIFGPILPMITFKNIEECVRFISSGPKPLALYLFGYSRKNRRAIIDGCSFGGGCFNDTLLHLTSSKMSFGGVGSSGMGSYHGKQSFVTFSHYKNILKKHIADVPLRYFPYTSQKERITKKILKIVKE